MGGWVRARRGKSCRLNCSEFKFCFDIEASKAWKVINLFAVFLKLKVIGISWAGHKTLNSKTRGLEPERKQCHPRLKALDVSIPRFPNTSVQAEPQKCLNSLLANKLCHYIAPCMYMNPNHASFSARLVVKALSNLQTPDSGPPGLTYHSVVSIGLSRAATNRCHFRCYGALYEILQCRTVSIIVLAPMQHCHQSLKFIRHGRGLGIGCRVDIKCAPV